jgi:hypothetical protein
MDRSRRVLDALHHLLGFELRLPHGGHAHRWRGLSVAIFASIAVAAFLALRRTVNKYERGVCWSLGLWFVYEAVRFGVWVKTHHLLHGPFSWLFWVPALGFLLLRTLELFQEPEA